MLLRGAFVGVFCLFSTLTAHADTFGSGENAFEIPFVTIGDPGNVADTVSPHEFSDPLPSGVVDYTYRIAKYEISETIIAKANAQSLENGEPLNLTIDVTRGPEKPATGLSWFEAARFVNFLNSERGSPVAYKFNETGVFQLWEPGDPGYDPGNPYRNTRAYYFLPSADEWHKAAFYDPIIEDWWDFPYGSDNPPVPVESGVSPGTAVINQPGPADVDLAGGESPFGVVGLAGNVNEWEETAVSLVNDSELSRRGGRGGWWTDLTPVNYSSSFRGSVNPRVSSSVSGLRIASVPELSSLVLVLAQSVAVIHLMHRRGSYRY